MKGESKSKCDNKLVNMKDLTEVANEYATSISKNDTYREYFKNAFLTGARYAGEIQNPANEVVLLKREMRKLERKITILSEHLKGSQSRNTSLQKIIHRLQTDLDTRYKDVDPQEKAQSMFNNMLEEFNNYPKALTLPESGREIIAYRMAFELVHELKSGVNSDRSDYWREVLICMEKVKESISEKYKL